MVDLGCMVTAWQWRNAKAGGGKSFVMQHKVGARSEGRCLLGIHQGRNFSTPPSTITDTISSIIDVAAKCNDPLPHPLLGAHVFSTNFRHCSTMMTAHNGLRCSKQMSRINPRDSRYGLGTWALFSICPLRLLSITDCANRPRLLPRFTSS